MTLIDTSTITYTVDVGEDRLRRQLTDEALRMHGLWSADGKTPKGVTCRIQRNGGRAGGYRITISRDMRLADQPLLEGPANA